MANVEYRQATCAYPGMSAPAVDSLDLVVEDGEFMVLVGPSGSGKSTALRMLAGLEMVSSGEILIGDRVVTGAPPKARDIAMVFQSYALYPHLSVADNLAFPLKQKGVSEPERSQRVLEAARLLELEPLLDRRPRQLSGGQRQRVAMGRAIVRQPQAFLMDEPLSNLDAKLRVQTRAEIAALQQRLGTTTVYVTHDQVEAMTLGHRVAVLRDGVLQQCDTPRRLYEPPCNVFVAGAPRPGPAAWAARRAGLSEVVLGLRPDALFPVTAGDSNAALRLSCEVHLVEDTGSDAWVLLDAPGGPAPLRLVARADPRRLPSAGERIAVAIRVAEAHVFDPASGVRLGD